MWCFFDKGVEINRLKITIKPTVTQTLELLYLSRNKNKNKYHILELESIRW